MPTAWASYLARFHAERAGITEAVLARSRSEGVDPYAWVEQAVPDTGPVVDVGCGSGPLADGLGGRWLGLDRSVAELALARARAPGRVVRADAGALPVADGAAGAVVCAMALMLLDPVDRAVTEVARVLRPGGRFVVLLPATAPLGLRDRVRYGRLLLALGVRHLPFPGSGVLDRPEPVLAAAGLRVVGDERRRFDLRLDGAEVADQFVRSLYLPAARTDRTDRARALVRRWVGSGLGVPLRRIVAEP